MSLTQTDTLFASVHENGLNDFAQAFFTARPRYLAYGSPSFVPSTSVSATSVPAIPFPGIPTGIQYRVDFSIPKIDLAPDTAGMALPPGPGQLSLATDVKLTVGCVRRIEHDQERPEVHPISTKLALVGLGTVTAHYFGPGTGEIGIQIEKVEIVDIAPDSLESVLECVIRMVLQAAIADFRIPFSALSLGFATLVLKNGPVIQDDEVKLWADIA